MGWYIIIGVVVAWLSSDAVFEMLDSQYCKKMEKALISVNMQWLAKAIPIIATMELVIFWPLVILAVVIGMLLALCSKSKAKRFLINQEKMCNNAVDSFVKLCDEAKDTLT